MIANEMPVKFFIVQKTGEKWSLSKGKVQEGL